MRSVSYGPHIELGVVFSCIIWVAKAWWLWKTTVRRRPKELRGASMRLDNEAPFFSLEGLGETSREDFEERDSKVKERRRKRIERVRGTGCTLLLYKRGLRFIFNGVFLD